MDHVDRYGAGLPRRGCRQRRGIRTGAHGQLMVAVFESLLPVFLIVALGWVLRRCGVISREQWQGVEQLGFWVLFPALLFHALINADLAALSLDALIVSYLGAMAVIFFLLYLLNVARGRLFSMDGPTYSSVFQTTSRWNAFISLAVMDKYAGAEGLAVVALVIALTVLPLNVINMLVVTRTAAREGSGWSHTLAATARNPMVLGAFSGLLFNLLSIPVYEPVLVAVDLIAQAGLAIGLLTVGAALRIRSVFRPRGEMLFGLLGKMVLFPLLVLEFGLMSGLSGVPLVAAMVCASTPAAAHGYIVARMMGGDADLYATTSAAQTLLAMVSMPFFLWLTLVSA